MRRSGGPSRPSRTSPPSPQPCAETCAGPPSDDPPEGLFTHGIRGSVSEAVCKPSSVLPRLARRRGWPSIWGRRSPDGSCGRPEGWAAHLSPADGRPPRVAPSYLALLRVEFARFTPVGGSRRRPASSLWHWSSPHGGRALPATLRCGARTFLTPRAGRPAGDARPSDRLADRSDTTRTPGAISGDAAQTGGRRTTDAGPPACARSIASLASASATEFWARGTCAADQRSKPASVCARAPSRAGSASRP